MRGAVDVAFEQLDVLSQLRVGEQPTAGVIEIHVPTAVQPPEVGGAKLVENSRVGVAWVVAAKRGFRRLKRLELGARDAHSARCSPLGSTATSMPCRTLWVTAQRSPNSSRIRWASIRARWRQQRALVSRPGSARVRASRARGAA